MHCNSTVSVTCFMWPMTHFSVTKGSLQAGRTGSGDIFDSVAPDFVSESEHCHPYLQLNRSCLASHVRPVTRPVLLPFWFDPDCFSFVPPAPLVFRPDLADDDCRALIILIGSAIWLLDNQLFIKAWSIILFRRRFMSWTLYVFASNF